MRLKHVTFTGVDAKTDIRVLQEIQRQFPFVEFGVLTSYHWYENGNRYLNPAFICNLYASGLNLALHVCGSAAHDAAVGDWSKVDQLIFGSLDLFKRIQLNVSGRNDNPRVVQMARYSWQEVIIQQRSGQETALYNETLNAWRPNIEKFSVLLDASGGRGINTELKVLPSSGKVGYAGGFNPENVEDKLSFLMRKVKTGEFWIDMESGVRTEDWFDIDKVVKVLNVCKKVIDDF